MFNFPTTLSLMDARKGGGGASVGGRPPGKSKLLY